MTIDRSSCNGTRHGTVSAYYNFACRCPDAREAYRIYRKRAREGRHQPALVSSVGTQRRLRALAAIGWDINTLARRGGYEPIAIRNWRAARCPRIKATQAARIAALYEQLSGTQGPSSRSCGHARREGWAPPLLWDELDIDDPAVNPHDDAAAPARRGRIDTDDVTHLARFGLPLDVIAARLRVQPSSIERHLERDRARARAQGAAA
jgi:hypothetical protein